MMSQWKLRTITVDAVRWTGNNHDEVRAFVGDGIIIPLDGHAASVHCYIAFPARGARNARPGDWIIRHEDGTLSPCGHGEFTATYEPASTPPAEGEPERRAAHEALDALIDAQAKQQARPSVWANGEVNTAMEALERGILAAAAAILAKGWG